MAILESEELRFLELLETATAKGDERGELLALEGLDQIGKMRGIASQPDPETLSPMRAAGMLSPIGNPEAMLSVGSGMLAGPKAMPALKSGSSPVALERSLKETNSVHVVPL